MTKYNGRLKTKAQAQALAAKLRATGLAEAQGAASLLETNWQYVAARPAMQPEMLALAECESPSADRVGSVAHRLLERTRE